MRVLVCGGRTFGDARLVFATLDQLHREKRITTIIHGAARGADSFASEWARAHANRYASTVREEAYPADWKKNGRAAGPIRNARMISEGKPELCVAFPGGKGTADMVRQCERAGVKVMRVG